MEYGYLHYIQVVVYVVKEPRFKNKSSNVQIEVILRVLDQTIYSVVFSLYENRIVLRILEFC